MTNVDKNVKPGGLTFWLDDDKELLEYMRQCSEEEGFEAEFLCVDDTRDRAKANISELYLDEENNCIRVTMEIQTSINNAGIGSTVEIPLTNGLVLDLLSYSVKRLNKMKAAMEALK